MSTSTENALPAASASETAASEAVPVKTASDVPVKAAPKKAVETDAEFERMILALSEQEAKARVLKQVEFYFADANLPFDRFLFTLTQQNPDGWVKIETVSGFKRMRPLMKKLGIESIAAALRESPSLLEVDEAGENVRRSKAVELKATPAEISRLKTVYAKGFPEETSTLMDEITTYFSKWGPVSAVRFRREEGREHTFKGSVYVEFEDVKHAEELLKADPKPEWDGKPLTLYSKAAYMEMKDIEQGRDPKTATKTTTSTGFSKKFNAFKELARGTNFNGDGKSGKNDWKPKSITYLSNQIDLDDNGNVADETQIKYPTGLVCKFSNASDESNGFKALQETLKKAYPDCYVQFPRGSTEGHVTFGSPLSESQVQALKDSKIEIGSSLLEWTPVTGDAEKAFHLDRAKFMAQRTFREADPKADGKRGNNNNNSRGGRGQRGRGGYKGNAGGRERNSERPSKDSQKSEEKAVANNGVPVVTGEKRKAVESAGGDEKKAKTA